DRKKQYVPCKKLLCFVSSEVTTCVICFTFVFEVVPNQIQLVKSCCVYKTSFFSHFDSNHLFPYLTFCFFL
ncbi:unnamed protein product, partial [Brassica oleracea]